MNKFNLTFSGEILAGHDPVQVRLRFANMFDIDDPVRLERFFSGDTIILRRNLERKAAAQCYHELHLLGALAALVKVPADEADAANIASTPTPPATKRKPTGRKADASEPGKPARKVASEQTWAVSSAAARPGLNGKKRRTSVTTTRDSTPAAWPRNSVDIAAGIKARKLETQQLAAQKAAREHAALAEQQRASAEAAARKQAETAKRERLAREEAEQQEAERRRQADAETARLEAQAAAAARQAAEEAARRAEEQALARQREAEEAARKLAIKEEAKRKAAEEASRRKAQRKQQKAEQEQRKAQAAARRKAELAEKRQREAEAAAQRKAALQEKRRLEAEEAARRKAAEEEKNRLEAEEAARRKAAEEEKRRQQEEEAARRKAAMEEQRREAAEAAARCMAELEKKQRLEAEQARQRKAALEEQRRLEAEETARQQAELEELQRREAEEEALLQAELAAIRQREEEEARRLQVELEEQARQAAARIKAEALQQQQEAQRKSAERRRAINEALAVRQARQAQKRANSSVQHEPQPTERPPRSRPAVQELPLRPPNKRAKGRIRTALEVPPRAPRQDTHAPLPEQRKRQSGEPNVYKLRPFRNSDEVRTRAARATRRARQCYSLGIFALAALLVVAGGFMQRAITPALPGARAVAVDPGSGPTLLAHDSLLLHDRAGIGTGVQPLSALGVDTLDPPIAFDDAGALLAMGRLRAGDATPAAGSARQLLRCDAPLAQCRPFSPQLADNSIDAFAINPVDGSLLLADRSVGMLLKTDRQGALTARAEVALADRVVLRLHSGLLLMNSATAPAISVLRYENNAFGQQLDEILLLPPGVEELEHLRVDDFLWSGDAWWVNLRHPGSGQAGLYRFDEEWNFIDAVDLPGSSGALQLVNWGEKILANDPGQLAIARINAEGVVEAPFVSPQLEQASAEQQRRAWLANFAWRGALVLSALGVALGLGLGYLHSRRAVVYQPRREQGAAPLDEHVNALQWVDPAANRPALLRRRINSYAVFALGVILLAIASSVGVWQMTALLLALSGPLVALLLLSRRSIGHIGILDDRLLLVDHSGTYQLAGGSRVQYRGPFLFIDDVVVYCGGALLPAFSAPQVQQQVRPLALGGVKVDRDTVLVKLLQSRHPIALGALAIVTAITLALVIVSLRVVA